jgi:hypothetical protein
LTRYITISMNLKSQILRDWSSMLLNLSLIMTWNTNHKKLMKILINLVGFELLIWFGKKILLWKKLVTVCCFIKVEMMIEKSGKVANTNHMQVGMDKIIRLSSDSCHPHIILGDLLGYVGKRIFCDTVTSMNRPIWINR